MTVTAGRKRKRVQQTFALYDGEVRVADHMKGFRRVLMVLCEYLPAVQDEDLVVFHAPQQQLTGEAKVIEHRHIRGSEGMSTALVIHIGQNEQEVEGG